MLLSLKINKIKIIYKKINFNSRYQSKNPQFNKHKNINNIAKTTNKLSIKQTHINILLLKSKKQYKLVIDMKLKNNNHHKIRLLKMHMVKLMI